MMNHKIVIAPIDKAHKQTRSINSEWLETKCQIQVKFMFKFSS